MLAVAGQQLHGSLSMGSMLGIVMCYRPASLPTGHTPFSVSSTSSRADKWITVGGKSDKEGRISTTVSGRTVPTPN